MVTDNHYRWDFVGLSTDEKPTPATSHKVVDGSTFYCSDTSKLYVWCRNQWYERKALGGGGGGGDIDLYDFAPSIRNVGRAMDSSFIEIPDGYGGAPIQGMNIQLTPTQLGVGEPSTTNVRDIVFSTSIQLHQSGEDTTDYETYSLAFPEGSGKVLWFDLEVTPTGGTLTITPHGYLELDGVTEGKMFPAGASGFSSGAAKINLPDGYNYGKTNGGITISEAEADYILCNCMPLKYWNEGVTQEVSSLMPYVSSSVLQYRFSFDSLLNITDSTTANAYINTLYQNGTPLAFTYPLASATPQTYQLTASQVAELMSIKTLEGYNKFWLDFQAESMNIDYLGSTTLSLEADRNSCGAGTKVKFLTWNVHHYSSIESPDATFDDNVISTMKPYLIENNFDIILTQENLVTFRGNGKDVDTEIYKPLFPYCKNQSDEGYKSKFKIYDYKTYASGIHFPTSHTGYLTSVRALLGGREVLIVNVHMTSGASSATVAVRETQYEDLINIIKDEEYVIMAGDFNPNNGAEQTEFNRLINLGYRAANMGYFGEFKTLVGTVSQVPHQPVRPCDNIFTTPNIIITSVDLPDINPELLDELSDHRPLCAQLFIS